MEDFLKQIGIVPTGTMSDDGCYVMDIEDSNEYGKIYSVLDQCDEVYEDEDSSFVTSEQGSIQYINDKYTLTLISQFDTDIYRLTVREN